MPTISVPDLRQQATPLTKDQVKQRLSAAGCTIMLWSEQNNFDREVVSRVLHGACKAKYGKGHDIAVALGMKIAPLASNNAAAV